MVYSVRGLEWSELGGSHGCPGRLWDQFLWQVYQNDSRHDALDGVHRPVIKIGPKGALGSHEIRPIHSAPSLGQSIGMQRSIYLQSHEPILTFLSKSVPKIQQNIEIYRVDIENKPVFGLLSLFGFLSDTIISHFARSFQKSGPNPSLTATVFMWSRV